LGLLVNAQRAHKSLEPTSVGKPLSAIQLQSQAAVKEGKLRFTRFEILDDCEMADRLAIEVVIHLQNQSRRWCFFATPNGLGAFGDWLPGTQVRAHYGSPHMVVVSEISPAIVELALRTMESQDVLEACTRPCVD
jgi:hypothetical protein